MALESLSLCHGTSQPVGRIVELELRANPNGEPLPALQRTPGIWAADNASLCQGYAGAEKGLVIGDSRRFEEGTEGQVYHFDLPTVQVETVETAHKEREVADRLVEEALAKGPDVLRLHRRVGTEYLILKRDAANLVRITNLKGQELPPASGMTLSVPSPEYCQRQAELLGRMVEKTAPMVADLRTASDALEDFPDIDLKRPWGQPDNPDEPLFRAHLAKHHAVLREIAQREYERLLADPERGEALNYTGTGEALTAAEYFKRRTLDWLDAHQPDQLDIISSAMPTHYRHMVMPLMVDYIMDGLYDDYGYQRNDVGAYEGKLASAQRDLGYWRERCLTGLQVPSREYCQAELESAEADVAYFRQQWSEAAMQVKRLERQRPAAQEESPGERKARGDKAMADEARRVAQDRADYWRQQCARLERPAIGENVRPYLESEAEAGTERRTARGRTSSALKSKSGYAPRGSRQSRQGTPAEIKRFARRAGRK